MPAKPGEKGCNWKARPRVIPSSILSLSFYTLSFTSVPGHVLDAGDIVQWRRYTVTEGPEGSRLPGGHGGPDEMGDPPGEGGCPRSARCVISGKLPDSSMPQFTFNCKMDVIMALFHRGLLKSM